VNRARDITPWITASSWYIDAVLTGNGKEIAAVRQVVIEQGTLDFLSFK
jgi:hypothetical protein